MIVSCLLEQRCYKELLTILTKGSETFMVLDLDIIFKTIFQFELESLEVKDSLVRRLKILNSSTNLSTSKSFLKLYQKKLFNSTLYFLESTPSSIKLA